ncbi:hypothetical protein [Pseudoxanthobacter sp.]|uniref:hypothetical protein n=1 Tax=Pseudoxanthobacter sp. TaxID=1925742 RepID=UPI002FE1759C
MTHGMSPALFGAADGVRRSFHASIVDRMLENRSRDVRRFVHGGALQSDDTLLPAYCHLRRVHNGGTVHAGRMPA